MKRLTRIKYELTNGVYTSHKEFLGNGGNLLNVQINTSSNTVSVMQVSSEVYTVVESAKYTTLMSGKALAKKLLIKYGVVFYEEVRRKKVVSQEIASPTDLVHTLLP